MKFKFHLKHSRRMRNKDRTEKNLVLEKSCGSRIANYGDKTLSCLYTVGLIKIQPNFVRENRKCQIKR